jgi:hypothetical protein
MSMKKSSDTIGTQTRDLSACSAVPQQTAPPRAPHLYLYLLFVEFIRSLQINLKFVEGKK